MLERIAVICRGIASENRLLILYHLHLQRELPASEIARRAGISRDLASNHLKLLTNLALLHPRRSGAYIYYRLSSARSRAGTFAPLGLIRRAFRDLDWAMNGWNEAGTLHLSPRIAETSPQDVTRTFDVVFDAATAFSNVRRLQILRYLTRTAEASSKELQRALNMSANAVSRHLDKLLRRGYVSSGGENRWSLSREPKTRFHAKLLELVLSVLPEPSRS